jgi:hypothetical protein
MNKRTPILVLSLSPSLSLSLSLPLSKLENGGREIIRITARDSAVVCDSWLGLLDFLGSPVDENDTVMPPTNTTSRRHHLLSLSIIITSKVIAITRAACSLGSLIWFAQYFYQPSSPRRKAANFVNETQPFSVL